MTLKLEIAAAAAALTISTGALAAAACLVADDTDHSLTHRSVHPRCTDFSQKL